MAIALLAGGGLAAGLGAAGAATGRGVFIVAAIVTGVAAMIAAITPVAMVSAKVKNATVGPALTAMGMAHTEKGFDAPAYETLKRFSLIGYHQNAKFEDLITGGAAGAGFALCEAHLTKQVKTKNSTRTVTVFRGLIGQMEHPAEFLGETVLSRDMGWFNALAAPKGMKRAGLVDSGFERIFEVWTTDQVEARYLITPLVMERLLELEQRFHGKSLRAAFTGGGLVFALDSKNLFEAGSIFTPMDDPRRMQRLAGEVGAVTGLVSALREMPAGA